MKKLIFSFFIALSVLKASAQSILLTPGNQTTTNTAPDLILRSTGDPDVRGTRSAGTLASPAPVTSGSSLLRLRGRGFWSPTSSTDQVAIDMFASETWNASANGTNMRFLTTQNGTFSLTEKMRIENNGNIGIGTTSPSAKLEVTGAANTEVRISTNLAGFGSSRLGFYSDKGTANEWRPGYVATGDDGSFTGRLDFYTNGTGAANKLGNVLGMSMVNGKVGIGGSPDFPLHVTSSTPGTSSTSGAFAIGATNSFHLTFDNNQIDSWSNTVGNTLFLNYYSNAKVQIGNGTNGNLDVNGFSNLGDGAPAIKMKKFSGTIPLSATTHSIAHGLTKTKILGLQIFVESSVTGNRYLPNDGAVGASTHYEIQLDNTNIVFQNIGVNLDGEPYIIVVTYEQ